MKQAILTFSLLLLLAQGQSPQINLELGDPLSDSFPVRSEGFCKTGTDERDQCIFTEINGLTCFLAHKEGQRTISFILTLDPKFVTSDGHRVGDTIELTRPEVTVYPDWETRGPLTKDCWYPVVGFDGGIYYGRGRGLAAKRLSPNESFAEAGLPTEHGVIKTVIGGFAKGVCSSTDEPTK